MRCHYSCSRPFQEVSYGSGEFEGTEYTDTVTIGGSLAIADQSIGVASSSEGFEGVDGIIGCVSLAFFIFALP